VPRHDEICGHESAAAAQQAADQRRGDPERRVGHNLERPPWKPEITRVDVHHGDRRVGEPAPEVICATRVELDGDDACAHVDQLPRERAGTGPDVEHEVTRIDPRGGNEAASPGVSELMPSPAGPPFGGHGAP
jgi:hypothetical protein